jgi:hypothetical protein
MNAVAAAIVELQGKRASLVHELTVIEQAIEVLERVAPPVHIAAQTIQRPIGDDEPANEPNEPDEPAAAPAARPAQTMAERFGQRKPERSDAILKFLRSNNGLGTNAQLRKAMPKEPGLTDDQRDMAFRNTMTKLRTKGLVARTGQTWSLVGAGSGGA